MDVPNKLYVYMMCCHTAFQGDAWCSDWVQICRSQHVVLKDWSPCIHHILCNAAPIPCWDQHIPVYLYVPRGYDLFSTSKCGECDVRFCFIGIS